MNISVKCFCRHDFLGKIWVIWLVLCLISQKLPPKFLQWLYNMPTSNEWKLPELHILTNVCHRFFSLAIQLGGIWDMCWPPTVKNPHIPFDFSKILNNNSLCWREVLPICMLYVLYYIPYSYNKLKKTLRKLV